MARTITEIRNGMTGAFVANETIINYYGLDPAKTFDEQFSKLSIENIIFSVIATAMVIIETIFDTHKIDVEEIVAQKSPHSLLWYSNKAKEFQYGYSLIAETDQYETEDEEAQIIKFAAASEGIDGFLKLKLAKEGTSGLDYLSGEWPNNGISAPMNETSGGSGEKLAFYTFMERVKDAGVKIRYVSREADHMRIVLDLYYDPMVFNESGERLDGTNNTPVQDAVTAYLEGLPFNGEYSNMALTDALQAVDGVKIPQLLSTETYWGTYEWTIISALYKPESGWMKIYEVTDLIINWIPYGS